MMGEIAIKITPFAISVAGLVWIWAIGSPDDWRTYAVLGFSGAVILAGRD